MIASNRRLTPVRLARVPIRLEVWRTDPKETAMPDVQKLADEIKRMRDEVKLKIRLGSMEAKDEWAALEHRWKSFHEKAELNRTAGEVGSTVKQLGSDLKAAYERIRKAI